MTLEEQIANLDRRCTALLKHVRILQRIVWGLYLLWTVLLLLWISLVWR